MSDPRSDSPLPTVIADHARRLHGDRQDHHVASPLGAWLLLALAAQAVPAEHPARAEVATALGLDVAAAGDAARALLATPHADLLTATGAWLDERARTQRIAAWAAALPASTSRGGIPSQAELDGWAERGTDGLITEFPLEVSERTLFLLATAIAARISWAVPFEDCPAAELGGAWADSVPTALRSPPASRPSPGGHQVAIVDTETGRGLVHAAGSTEGLQVVSLSVPGATPAAQIAAAHQLASTDPQDWPRVSLFDLELGDHPDGAGTDGPWTITETEVAGRTDQEAHHAVLPPWRSRVEIDLTADPALGLTAAGTALSDLLPAELAPYEIDAVQTCVAEYTRTGFAAAAVSALGIRATSLPSGRCRRREAALRFNQPYAVVAVTEDPDTAGPWDRLPVFSGWISDPTSQES